MIKVYHKINPFEKTKTFLKEYVCVASVITNSLNMAVLLTNNKTESWTENKSVITTLKECRDTKVGDVLYNSIYNTWNIITSKGFREVKMCVS